MLSQQERDEIEQRLQAERESALAAIQRFDEAHAESLEDQAGEMSVYRFHMADIGTEAMEREKSFLLASKEGERLYRVDEALRRLYGDPESFGSCSNCGKPIGMERLRVVPDADLCSDCQRQAEG